MKKYDSVLGILILLSVLAVAMAQTNKGNAPRFNAPEIVSTSEAVYPVNAVGGDTVVLSVAVSASGDIQDVKVVRDAPGFRPSAMEAIKEWKFKPATLDGKPVAAVIPVAFSFGFPAVCAGR